MRGHAVWPHAYAWLPCDNRATRRVTAASPHGDRSQVFGPREQLSRLRQAHGNSYHFEKLAVHAGLAERLGASYDENYFAPLRDLQRFQVELHTTAGLCRAAQEGLLVYGMNARRRSGRAK